MDPRRNVELKARDPDPARTLAAALAHGAEDHGVLNQRVTYFNAGEGRLKLREEDERATLIAYERADEAVARLSAYHLVDVPDPAALRTALDDALGITVVVAKQRRLLLWRDVRIHLDEVEGLGSWVELEAVAPPDSDLADEHAKVAELRQVLDIHDGRIASRGYAAMVLEAVPATPTPVPPAAPAMGRPFGPDSEVHARVGLRDGPGGPPAGPNVQNPPSPEGQRADAPPSGAAITGAVHRIVEVPVIADPALTPPYGGCRQGLAEFADADTPEELCGPEGIRRTVTIGELLPL